MESTTESLEERVKRLEDALASLQDTHVLEDRVFDRVRRRLDAPAADPADKVVDRKKTALRITQDPDPLPEPEPAGPGPERQSPPPPPNVSPEMVREAWFIVDVWKELSAIFRMFFDVRYHVGWFARLTVFILVPAILLSHWFVPFTGLPVVGQILDKCLALILGFFVYKILSREARRYVRSQREEKAYNWY